MKKKWLLAFILIVFIAGGAFAQGANAITIDLIPLHIGLELSQGNLVNDDFDYKVFCGALQYERQLTREISLGLRVYYLWLGVGTSMVIDSVTNKIELEISTLSVDGLFRYYPGGRTFFVGAIFGYGNMEYLGKSSEQGKVLDVTTNYFKVGPRLGWRITFGTSGFIMDIFLGYDYAYLVGSSTMQQMTKQNAEMDDGEAGTMFKELERDILVGGPRFGFSLGWRF